MWDRRVKAASQTSKVIVFMLSCQSWLKGQCYFSFVTGALSVEQIATKVQSITKGLEGLLIKDCFLVVSVFASRAFDHRTATTSHGCDGGGETHDMTVSPLSPLTKAFTPMTFLPSG
jgi:hypothetical protein